MPAVNREIAKHVPEEFGVYHPFPGRSQDKAEYLIDPARYRRPGTYEERERTLPYRILFGQQPFAEHATGVQGVQWRCSTSEFLAELRALARWYHRLAGAGLDLIAIID